MNHPKCFHCGQWAVYLDPHEIWCVNCGEYFAGEPPWIHYASTEIRKIP